MNDITKYAILVGSAIAFTFACVFINIKASHNPTKVLTLTGIYVGLGLALATLVKMTTEVWS